MNLRVEFTGHKFGCKRDLACEAIFKQFDGVLVERSFDRDDKWIAREYVVPGHKAAQCRQELVDQKFTVTTNAADTLDEDDREVIGKMVADAVEKCPSLKRSFSKAESAEEKAEVVAVLKDRIVWGLRQRGYDFDFA